MKKLYNDLKGDRLVLGLVKVSAMVAFIMVWILIDKGNVYGQSMSSDLDALQSGKLPSLQQPHLRGGDDHGGDLLDDEDEGNSFTSYPNPTKDDLVFDFEFTVKTGIDYEVFGPAGRLVDEGFIEPGLATYTLDMSRHQTGLYIIRMHIGSDVQISKVLKQ